MSTSSSASQSRWQRDGKVLKKSDHFEWMDAYIERLQFEGYIDSNGAATWELNLGLPANVVENWGDRAVTTTGIARNACNAEADQETSQIDGRFAEASKYKGRRILWLYHCSVFLLVVHPSLEGRG
ncbi:hypothetical protein D1007_32714 [Hordeum vulgare]|nr:hypothetical protein D1007_32714 [Hordeum vulgare]